MRAHVRNYLLIAGLAALLGGAAVWRHHHLAATRAHLREQERLAQVKAHLDAERIRLEAAQPHEEELARRAAEHAALVEVLSEIESIRRRLARPATAVTVPAVGPGESLRRPSLREAPLAAELWRDVGRSTPDAALETALWAAAAGDLERLAATLALDEEVRARATALFDRLPPALRTEMGSPERFVALLTAHAVPLGTAQILAQSQPGASEPYLLTRLVDPEGRSREVKLAMRNDGSQWRVVVPTVAINRFTAKLSGASGTR